MYRHMKLSAFILVILSSQIDFSYGERTTWTFDDSDNRFATKSGNAEMVYYDPENTGWGPDRTRFGNATSFNLSVPMGKDMQIMSFPACNKGQGYQLKPNFDSNGPYGESNGFVSNYTVVMDVLFPVTSLNKWHALVQTDVTNGTDSELFINQNNGIGINGNYRGMIRPDTWHRIIWSVRAAAKEGQAQRYIDGQAVGAIGTTGSGLNDRWALISDLLLFTDENGETASGYVASISIIDRKLTHEEAVRLGGVNPLGADVPGPAAPPYNKFMPRVVNTLGHRGSSACAPENTLFAIRQAFLDGAAGTEIDTRITSDGVVVAFHDDTVDRTTDGVGEIARMTLEEVKSLDAGSWFSPAFAGTRVPTLEEVLNDNKGKGIIYLDIKTRDQAQGLANAVNASGFPIDDLWFWTPGNRPYAAEIRSLLPGAKIVWGTPDPSWRTDPDYFSDLRELGVIGFSIGYGGVDLNFTAAAKAEGMIVEVFTVLDPDTMIAVAESGVDYIETDIPIVMEMLQPPRETQASNPEPRNGTADVSGNPLLSWTLAEGDVQTHKIYFGTNDPPPFYAETTADMYRTGPLKTGKTYFWRIDTVTDEGTVKGKVWQFTTTKSAVDGNLTEWHFNGNLDAVAGDAVLDFNPSTESLIEWRTSDGNLVPHMEDGPTDYLRIPALDNPIQGISLSFNSARPNGNGNKINQYTFVFDVLVPSPLSWTPFFNTNPNNSDDADFFIKNNSSIGIGQLGYSDSGTFRTDAWQRVIFSADLQSSQVNYYIDGEMVHVSQGAGNLKDSRFSLYAPPSDPAPHLILFNDNDGESHEIMVGSMAFVDTIIDEETADALGKADPEGIFFKTSQTPITNIEADPDNSSLTIEWNAQAGKIYTISANSSLNRNDWKELGKRFTSKEKTESFTETGIDYSTIRKRFYRIQETR